MAFLGKSVRLNRLMPQGDGLYLGLTVDPVSYTHLTLPTT